MTPLAKQLRACKTHKERLKLLEDHSPGANLCGAKLSGIDLRGGNFVDADFDGADLSDADLRDTDFRRAYLRRTNLHRAYLCGADFEGADLRYGDFRGSDLRGSDLRAAYLCKYHHWAVIFTDDDMVKIGCKIMPSIAAWDEWFAGDEEFETKRGTEEFKLIRRNWEWAKGIWRRSKQ